MGYPDYRKDLTSDDFDHDYVLNRYFNAGQSMVFNGADPSLETDLIDEIAQNLSEVFKIRVHHKQIVISGSAHLGFSPVPDKLGKPFDATSSDIDVCVISPEIFESTWNELISGGLDNYTRQTVSRDLFWGFVNPANIKDCSESGRAWWKVFGAIKTDRAKGVRGRLYRSFWSMQSYHRIAFFEGREKLLAERSSEKT